MTYQDWIEENVVKPGCAYGNCKEFAKKLAEAFPELRIAAGYYVDPIWGLREHWWCVAIEGDIVDPTADQFPSKGHGSYQEVDPTKPPQRVSENPTPYAFRCERCGMVYMTDDEYTRQLMSPNSTWRCPQCGSGDGYFDDDNYEKYLDSEESPEIEA